MPNIETIAKKANVSTATVSRTLRNLDNLKTDNQRRIVEVARQIGYNFNKCKRNNLSKETKQIVFLSFAKSLAPEALHAENTYMPIVSGINKVVGEKGYNLIVSDVGIDEKPPPSLLRSDVDGIIFHGAMSHKFYEEYIKPLPHVGIQHYDPCLKCNWIISDQWSITFQSVEYLYKLGHRRIAFVYDFKESYLEQGRYKGYQDALQYFELQSHKDFELCLQRPRIDGIAPLETELPDYYPLLKKLMSKKNSPTAFICSCDFRALACAKALEKLNLSIPNDISIMGAHNKLPQFGFTGLSSNLNSVCSYAAQFLLELLNGKHTKTMKVMLQPTLHTGTSTKDVSH